jgi:hypothetical protein
VHSRCVVRSVIAIALLLFAGSAQAADVWDSGVWDAGVWDAGVWDVDPPAATTGSIDTDFISTAVPATAVYREGTAYNNSNGERYVAACTTPAAYLAGVGHTFDGATCIDPAGTIDVELAGWALTAIGEVVAAECEPEYYVNGIPRDVLGPVCMSEVD